MAKVGAFSTLGADTASSVELLSIPWPDVAVYMGLCALFLFAEARVPWTRAITWPLGVAALVLTAFGAVFVSMTGDTLNAATIDAGVERFGDTWGMLAETLRQHGAWVAAGTLAALGTPWALRKLARQRYVEHENAARWATWPALAALVAASLWVATPSPASLPGQRLRDVVLVETWLSWVAADERALSVAPPDDAFVDDAERFAYFRGPDMLGERGIARLREHKRPNLVFVLLESTRYDHVQLEAGDVRAASTPNLLALAERGLVAHRARAVLPHTTKSVYSVFCGRLPTMQFVLWEVSSHLQSVCLPDVLAAAGWKRRAFFQSAVGAFEERPRLAANLGFAELQSWETIQGEPLGYLASDDLSMAAPFASWLDEAASEGPFVAALLTSATHHPYRLPAATRHRLEAKGVDPASLDAAARYALLVEREDELVGEVVQALRERDLLQDTIIVALGDHGEGFAEGWLRQHDNNFYEVGLHVPLVMAGPGVPHRRVERDVDLSDVAPTVLEVLGAHSELPAEDPRYGHSMLANPVAGERTFFACYYEDHCYGTVEGGKKLVVQPARAESFWFDLQSDPQERKALSPTPDVEASMQSLLEQMRTVRVSPRNVDVGAAEVGHKWLCRPGEGCQHPDSPPHGFFEKPSD